MWLSFEFSCLLNSSGDGGDYGGSNFFDYQFELSSCGGDACRGQWSCLN